MGIDDLSASAEMPCENTYASRGWGEDGEMSEGWGRGSSGGGQSHRILVFNNWYSTIGIQCFHLLIIVYFRQSPKHAVHGHSADNNVFGGRSTWSTWRGGAIAGGLSGDGACQDNDISDTPAHRLIREWGECVAVELFQGRQTTSFSGAEMFGRHSPRKALFLTFLDLSELFSELKVSRWRDFLFFWGL